MCIDYIREATSTTSRTTKKLWSIANDLRGNMDANEFKNYILGLIFYRFLSEKVEETSARLLSEDNISYQEAMNNDDYRPIVEKELIQRIGFVIEPEIYSVI